MATITRSQAIADLRRELLKLVDDHSSLCEVAARRGLFCTGLERWTDEELMQCLPAGMRDDANREELLRRANRLMLGLQDIRSGRLPCDLEPDGTCLSPFCGGWDQFSHKQLARFYREMCGADVEILPDAGPRDRSI